MTPDTREFQALSRNGPLYGVATALVERSGVDGGSGDADLRGVSRQGRASGVLFTGAGGDGPCQRHPGDSPDRGRAGRASRARRRRARRRSACGFQRWTRHRPSLGSSGRSTSSSSGGWSWWPRRRGPVRTTGATAGRSVPGCLCRRGAAARSDHDRAGRNRVVARTVETTTRTWQTTAQSRSPTRASSRASSACWCRRERPMPRSPRNRDRWRCWRSSLARLRRRARLVPVVEVGQQTALDQQVRAMEAFGLNITDQMYDQMEQGMKRAAITGPISQAIFLPIVIGHRGGNPSRDLLAADGRRRDVQARVSRWCTLVGDRRAAAGLQHDAQLRQRQVRRAPISASSSPCSRRRASSRSFSGRSISFSSGAIDQPVDWSRRCCTSGAPVRSPLSCCGLYVVVRACRSRYFRSGS